MKAFLSHSSHDKAIVEDVASRLGLARCELDSLTFERGLTNAAAIRQALERCTLFVLFLSKNAIESGFVRYEALRAEELVAAGSIDRILVICLDEESFGQSERYWKTYNFIRRAITPQSISRLISSFLLISDARLDAARQPFVGRVTEADDIKTQLASPQNQETKAIFISGNSGIGRRTFAKKVFKETFPFVNSLMPEIYIERIDGLEEIYRKLLHECSPIETATTRRARIIGFSTASSQEKERQIADLVKTLIRAREAIIIMDRGGLLNENGAIQSVFRRILQDLEDLPYPAIIFIAERMVPSRHRQEISRIIYKALPALSENEVRQLIGILFRSRGIRFTAQELQQITVLCDGHPFNAQFVSRLAKEQTLPVFLANPDEIMSWKHRQGSEFLRQIELSDAQKIILSALRDFRNLDFSTLVEASGGDEKLASEAVSDLIYKHVIQGDADIYEISPPLRIAVERDNRLKLSDNKNKEILEAVSRSFTTSSDFEQIPLPLIEASVLAALQSKQDLPAAISAYFLPSHLVWLARRKYDDAKYPECIELEKRALSAKDRLSPAGIIESCRYLCLASARVGNNSEFDFGMQLLRRAAETPRARANVEFLLGFQARMEGNWPSAEYHYRNSLDLDRGNFSVLRELASICLARGDITAGEEFSRRALAVAPDNPFILDILASLLIRKIRNPANFVHDELETLLAKLKQSEEEDKRSFWETRVAELNLKRGNLKEARKMIETAEKKTPHIVQIHVLKADILLASGNLVGANDVLKRIGEILERQKTSDRSSNTRFLREVQARYYAACRQFEEAKQVIRDSPFFSDTEKAALVREIETDQAFTDRKGR